MHLFNKNNIKLPDSSLEDIFYMKFPRLSEYTGLEHRVFTRIGGTSGDPFKSLNVSYTVGDLPERVDDNLQIIKENIIAENLLYMNQVHGKKVISFSKKDARKYYKVPNADAVITDNPSLAIMIKQADCQGIILFDPAASVVSAVHSGWRGSVENILGETVKKMKRDFKCSPENIIAAIGPSLGPCCGEFITYEEIFPSSFEKFKVGNSNFDFWSISEMQLINAGLVKENIEIAGICTKCRTDLFFSYRGDNKTGRFATVAMIN
jgi:YfiH family protein